MSASSSETSQTSHRSRGGIPSTPPSTVAESALVGSLKRFNSLLRAIDISPRDRALLQGELGQLFGSWLDVNIRLLNDHRFHFIRDDLHDLLVDLRTTNHILATQWSQDGMTGLLNKPAFINSVASAMQMRSAPDRWGALAIIDLAKLKPLNDTHGHAAGDKVILGVTHLLRHTVRWREMLDTEFHARLGGDEFGFFLSDITGPHPLSTAQLIGERFRRAVLAHDWSVGKPEIIGLKVRVDIGIACFRLSYAGVPVEHLAHEVEAILECADHLMYEAKNAAISKANVALYP